VVCGKISGHLKRDIQWVIAHLFLYFYEADFIQEFLNKNNVLDFAGMVYEQSTKVSSFHSDSTSKLTVRGQSNFQFDEIE
jgi:hypothetical protein